MASLPTFTKIYHHDSYAAIDPKREALSVVGKTVLVTGGGYGIGAAIVKGFADAGATSIIIVGRKSSPLDATKLEVESFSTAKMLTYAADISNASAMTTIFRTASATVGKIDILVNCAGFLPSPALFIDSELDDWWRGFEVNVKGLAIVAQGFLKHAADNAVFLNLLQAENPSIRFVSVHPGLIKTDMAIKSGLVDVPFGDAKLPAHFLVWLASAEADFLKGRYVWVNWDVPELIERKDEIVNQNKLVLSLEGWPGSN
ncbi:NAD(P)-binding protein [Xylogone sp. PMI_703]|nr:NAD(P)-binding protein [Xylogone sp. PMI_703]